MEVITEKRVGNSLFTSGSDDISPLVAQLSGEGRTSVAGRDSPVPVRVTPVLSCGNVLVSGSTSGERLRSLLNVLVEFLL